MSFSQALICAVWGVIFLVTPVATTKQSLTMTQMILLFLVGGSIRASFYLRQRIWPPSGSNVNESD
jgi:hypothetical protein